MKELRASVSVALCIVSLSSANQLYFEIQAVVRADYDYSSPHASFASFQQAILRRDATVDGDYTLAGCIVALGFDFRDFEMAHRVEVLRQFPQHRLLIERLTP